MCGMCVYSRLSSVLFILMKNNSQIALASLLITSLIYRHISIHENCLRVEVKVEVRGGRWEVEGWKAGGKLRVGEWGNVRRFRLKE